MHSPAFLAKMVSEVLLSRSVAVGGDDAFEAYLKESPMKPVRREQAPEVFAAGEGESFPEAADELKTFGESESRLHQSRKLDGLQNPHSVLSDSEFVASRSRELAAQAAKEMMTSLGSPGDRLQEPVGGDDGSDVPTSPWMTGALADLSLSGLATRGYSDSEEDVTSPVQPANAARVPPQPRRYLVLPSANQEGLV